MTEVPFMRTLIRLISTGIWLFLFWLPLQPQSVRQAREMPHLGISENNRFFIQETGIPFFWMGDTGWLLFAKLNREEAEHYLDDRAGKGFNVVQVMVLHELMQTNAYGDSALIGGDVSRPAVTEGSSFGQPGAYDYWDHVDHIIGLAQERGLYMALVPVWGSNVRSGKVSLEQARDYATWLAGRVAERPNIIWLNGGDTRGDENTAIWNVIGESIRKHAPDHLISFHPFGRTASSMWFHRAGWLDFNMFQSGHRRYDQDDSELAYGEDNWRYVCADYALQPVKPTLDGEPSYEGIPQGLHDPEQPYWKEKDVRRYAYWSVFAGGCGFTYGHNAVMQMHSPGDRDPSYGVRGYWYDALDAPGAHQMAHLKKLMLSRPYFDRIPDQSLIASEQGNGYDYQVATRGRDYALVYTYTGRSIRMNMGHIGGEFVRAGWFDPRLGTYTLIGEVRNEGTELFDPPGEVNEGNDWVLVLDKIPMDGDSELH